MEGTGLDELQRARLAMLRSSLEVVKDALTTLERVRSFQAPSTATDDLRAAIRNAAGELAKVSGDATINQQLSTIVTNLLAAANAVAPEPTAARPILDLGPTAIDSSLRGPLVEASDQLDVIEADILAARELTGDERAAQLADTWRRLDTWQRSRDTIFVEYVDLVRGILVRDAGLDHDLCRIADELVRAAGWMGSFSWRSLTIPVSDDGVAVSSARLIRLGFPEWSVWTLPFTLYEFGRVLALEYGRMTAILEKYAADDDDTTGAPTRAEVLTWIGDAHAVGVMGPAYAWAFVILRGNPADDADDRRVALMLDALHRVNTMKGAIDPEHSLYEQDRTRIEHAWLAARADVAPATAIDAPPAVLTDVAQAIIKLVVPLKAGDWPQIAALGEALDDGTRPVDDIAAMLTPSTLHHAIAAAWIARMRPRAEAEPEVDVADLAAFAAAQAEAEQDRVRALAERTRQVCIAVIDSAESGAGGGGAPLPVTVATSMDKSGVGGKATEVASGGARA